MKNYFRGWTTVYGFTLRQSITKTSKFVTALVSILIIGAIILITIIAAKPEDEEYMESEQNYIEQGYDVDFSGRSPIQNVLVMDLSGLQETDFITLDPGFYGEYFNNVRYTSVEEQTRSQVIEAASKNSNTTIAVIITYENGEYVMESIIPHNSIIVKEDAEILMNQMVSTFSNNKIIQTNLNQEQLRATYTPVFTSYSEFGENTNMAAMLLKIFAPMLFSFILYFMLLFYGQNVSKSVSTEKTSKIMETLLTSIHPYAMITGKVLAVTTLGILQFVTWILSGVIGLYTGNAIANSMYPSHENSVIMLINFIKDNIGETGLTLPAFILAILVFGVGFLFYCVLAALAGSMVSKPEDVASTQGLYQFPIIISWLISYFAPLGGNNGLTTILRYIPFTTPFSVPAELITGGIGLGEGVVSLLVLVVFSFVIIILSSKIYKGLVLYTGNKVNMKTLGNILKG